MKVTNWLTILLFGFALMSCQENFNLNSNTNTQFNVRVNGVELPVWVRGNTASKKIAIFVNGGPGLTSLDAAQLNLMNFENIEKEYAIAYYDQRGTGNSQGVIKKESLTLKQYSKDLHAIIAVVKHNFKNPEIFLMSHNFGGYISAFYLLDYYDSNSVAGWINIDGSLIRQQAKEWEYRHTFLANIATEEMALGNNITHWNDALTWTLANPIISSTAQKDQWRTFIGNPGEFIIPVEEKKIKTREVFNVIFGSSYNPFPAFLSRNLKITANALNKEANGTNLLPELSRLKLPSLFIWGRYDDIVPPELGQESINEMGTPDIDKYFNLYLNSGHQPFVNEPNLFAQDVISFIGKY